MIKAWIMHILIEIPNSVQKKNYNSVVQTVNWLSECISATHNIHFHSYKIHDMNNEKMTVNVINERNSLNHITAFAFASMMSICEMGGGKKKATKLSVASSI